jgi:hypothetical protein
MSNLKKLTVEQLKAQMVEMYDGNAGEIINGFREMGITSEAKLKKALIGYMERNPAYQK